MIQNDYVNAVDNLDFSDDLAKRVRAADRVKPRFRAARTAVLAAVLCILLATTVVAADRWFRQNVRIDELGTIAPDASKENLMKFEQKGDLGGILVHTMKMNEDDDFLFGNDLLYSHDSGFLRVEEDYSLTALPSKSFSMKLEKDGYTYVHDLCFVETAQGIVTDEMLDHLVLDGRVLVNLWDHNERCWPVWVDVSTGTVEDALSGFHVQDFDGEVRYSQLFRSGILISCLNDSQNNIYWVGHGSSAVQKVDIPAGALDFILGDELLYRDADWNYYATRGGWEFYPVEGIPKTSDAMWEGLITCVDEMDALQIYDLVNDVVYGIPEISAYDPWIHADPQYDPFRSGYNATRNSREGSIVVTHDYADWANLRRMVDRIAYLDTDAMELKQLDIESGHGVWTFGWLGDHRFCVVSEDADERWLTVYEFAA